MLVENSIYPQRQSDIVSFRKMFLHEAMDRQVGQDITAVNDESFVADQMLNVFNASSGLQQFGFREPAREVRRYNYPSEIDSGIFPANRGS